MNESVEKYTDSPAEAQPRPGGACFAADDFLPWEMFDPHHGATAATLAVAWDWEHDREFVGLLAEETAAAGGMFAAVSPDSLAAATAAAEAGRFTCAVLLDRASDSDPRFHPLAAALRRCARLVVNPPALAHRAADKATMHMEFLAGGVRVPFTIIVSPHATHPEIPLTPADLAGLGNPFVVKPANTTGGGTGVVLGAESVDDVLASRLQHRNDKYILQERVVPALLGGRKAWFRVFFVLDEVIPTWWDDATHVYRVMEPAEVARHALEPLLVIPRRIARLCGLQFFSTEIALTARGDFLAVDYVNEICDMRLQSGHADGVPDAVVRAVARRIARACLDIPRPA